MMIENIKSMFFLKLIFSFTKKKKKLELVKYNKRLQKNLELSLFNHKLFSGRYIIFENKIKGKEYSSYNEVLLFEG